MDFLYLHIGSVGLVLDMLGVFILFVVVVPIGDQVILEDSEEEAMRKKKNAQKRKLLLLGFILIVIGFICQLISNEKSIH